jgi:hypothetical protein
MFATFSSGRRSQRSQIHSIKLAIPLSKLRVAPDGSPATLHSPANAHPLKVVTGKRNLLILDLARTTYNEQRQVIATRVKFKKDDLEQAQAAQAATQETKTQAEANKEHLEQHNEELEMQNEALQKQQAQSRRAELYGSGCSDKEPIHSLQMLHKSRQDAHTTDATDSGSPAVQYYGYSIVDLYEKSRTHLGLAKDAPIPRPVQPPPLGRVIAFPQVGGLHHRYERQAA